MEEVLKNKKIWVVGGGFDGEKEVSMRSANNVRECLSKNEIQTNLVEMSETFFQKTQDERPDIIYNALHGRFGEDGRFQGMLDYLKIPYTGEQSFQSSFCFEKMATKYFFLSNGIDTARYMTFGQNSIEVVKDRIKMENWSYPLVLKKSCSGSSVGVFMIRCEEKLDNQLRELELKGEDLGHYFLEEYIKGREITVGVIFYKNKIRVLPILGLTSSNDFYDYESKYTQGKTQFEIPAVLNKDIKEDIEKKCYDIFVKMGFAQCIRIDFIISGDRAYALEINTSPGFTDTSDIPIMLDKSEINPSDFCEYNLLCANYFSI